MVVTPIMPPNIRANTKQKAITGSEKIILKVFPTPSLLKHIQVIARKAKASSAERIIIGEVISQGKGRKKVFITPSGNKVSKASGEPLELPTLKFEPPPSEAPTFRENVACCD